MRYLSMLLVLAISGCDRKQPAAPRIDAKSINNVWTAFSAGPMTLDTPISLAPSPMDDNSGQLLVEGFEGTSSDRSLTLAVIHQVYPKGWSFVLDEGGRASLTSVAANEGDPAPEVSSSEIRISGVKARRIVYEGNIHGRQTWIDSAYLQAGQDFWAVIVVRRAQKQEQSTQRILNSIRLSEAAISSAKAFEELFDEPLPPYDPDYRRIEAWIKDNDPGPLMGRQCWWPVADQVAIYAELQPRYRQWRENNPGDQAPPVEFEDLYQHEVQNEANQIDEPLQFPHKLLRLRYLIEIDGRPFRKDRVFVLHDNMVRRVEETDVVFLKSLLILQIFRFDMLAPE